MPYGTAACGRSPCHLPHQSAWPIIGGMSHSDPQDSGNSGTGLAGHVYQFVRMLVEKSRVPTTPNPEYICPPQLGIIHLLAWMTVAAVLLGIYEYLYLGRSRQPVTFVTWLIMFSRNLQAAALVGAGVAINAKIHQPWRHFQPGHWLLLYLGLTTLLTLVSRLFERLAGLDAYAIPHEYFSPIVSSGKTLLEMVIFFWIAWQIPEPGRWKNFFKFWAWCIIASLVLYLFFYLVFGLWRQGPLAPVRVGATPPPTSLTPPLWQFIVAASVMGYTRYLLPMLFLMVVVVMDARRKRKRDWLHWFGVVITVLAKSIFG
jgi:hypothetical protein